MSGAQTAERVSFGDPFAMSFSQEGGAGQMVAVPSGMQSVGAATDRAMAEVFVAQRVPIKRNLGAILQDAKALATAASTKFYYSIPFKNRKKGTTDYVQGPTIGCAMAAVSVYGNCRVEAFPAQESATHWTFVARFVDYEKGLTVMRAFQQRKGQNTGMSDADRGTDLVFQIGQSKAIRNVVIAALGWLTDEMETAAKNGILDRIAASPDAARTYLRKEIAALEVPIDRVERVVGRPVDKWLAPDMAKLYAQLTAVRDGMADVDDLFPESAAAADELREAGEGEPGPQPQEAKAAEPEKPKPQRKPAAPKAETKPAAKAAPEPEPEPQGDTGPSNEERAREEAQAEADATAERAAAAAHAIEEAEGSGLEPEGDEGFGSELNFQ